MTPGRICVILRIVKSCDEDPAQGKTLREESTTLRGLCETTMRHTTSEPMVGNSHPGAPVNASMSGSVCCNQGGTVEYFCIPPLIFQGVGIFYTLPH